MDNATPPLPASVAPEAGRWEIAEQWRLAWRGLKWTAAGLLAFLALISVGQIYLFHQMFSDVHVALGWAFIAAITVFFIWFIGLPLYRFFRAPAIAHPPNVDLASPTVTLSQVLDRVEFDDAYLKGMSTNPALADKHEDIRAAHRDLMNMRDDAKANNIASATFAHSLADFERTRMAVLLADLDKEIDGYIRKEALSVGSATAVSLNGSIDAFVVLWRNVNMVSRISRLYFGRPNLRMSMMIMRDVMVAVVLSRALDDVADAAGDALSGAVTKLGGMVIGPVMDGSVNALMTMKIGYLAKKRCRSFDVWSQSKATQATIDVFNQVKRESASLIADMLKTGGGFVGGVGQAAAAAAGAAGNVVIGAKGVAANVGGKVIAAPKSAWAKVQDALVKKPKNEET